MNRFAFLAALPLALCAHAGTASAAVSLTALSDVHAASNEFIKIKPRVRYSAPTVFNPLEAEGAMSATEISRAPTELKKAGTEKTAFIFFRKRKM